MKYQRFVSLTAMLSFVIMVISSGVLYFIADRKVTSWTGWNFLGLDKQQWDNLHINLGILFLVMLVWHIYFNFKPIKNYLKVKKELKIFTKEFNVALVLTLLFSAGTITMTLPFSFLVNIGNGIKAMNSLENGNPPFGYAEYTTIYDFCKIAKIDITQALSKLKSKGVVVNSPKEMLKTISSNNDISPRDIFQIIQTDATRFNLPTDIPIGIAQKSILELSKVYTIDINKLQKHLNYYHIEFKVDENFKRIAKRNNLHPAQLYNMLLASQG